jgi:hypothetical protein
VDVRRKDVVEEFEWMRLASSSVEEDSPSLFQRASSIAPISALTSLSIIYYLPCHVMENFGQVNGETGRGGDDSKKGDKGCRVRESL